MTKVLSRSLLSFALLIILAFTLSPELLRWKLGDVLAQNGIEARIGHLGLSLRKGEISLSNVQIKEANELDLTLGYASIQVDLFALQENRLVIEGLSLLKVQTKIQDALELSVDAMSLRDHPIIMPISEGQALDIGTEGQLLISGIELSADNVQPFSIAHFELNQAQLQGETLSLGEISFEGLKLFLETREGNAAPMPEVFAPLMAKDASSNKAQTNEQQSNFKVEIDNINLGGDSEIVLLDHTHEPATEIRFSELSFSLREIDTSNPSGLSPFLMGTKVGEYGSVEMEGQVAIFSEKTNLDLKGKIAAIDLPAFSSYLHTPLAHQITSGQLNSELAINIKEDKLDGQADLDLQKFYLDALNKDERPDESDPTLMPIGTALNLLRDGDDRIEFRLPMSGDMTDPEFSAAHIMGIVARKALTEAVINYYTPLGLVSVAGALVDSATTLSFPPITYKAGSQDYAQNPAETLEKVNTLLTARERISITLCAKSSLQDHNALFGKGSASKEQSLKLEELAKLRAQTLKQTLVDQGVAPERIIPCKASYDDTLNTAGQATLKL